MAMTIHSQPPSSSVTNHCYLHRSPLPPSLAATTTTNVHQPSPPPPSPSLNRLTRSTNVVVFLPLCHYNRSSSIFHPLYAITVVLLQSSIHHFNVELHQWLQI
ncbi:hypothetical protein CsSME_00006725 [Camellia sinensis var. sinensis]